jgi:hypothetical protein
MPGIKISALPAAASAQLSDVFPADQIPGPVTRKISLTQVLALFQTSIAPGAPNGSVQYNNGGAFGGDSGFISDGAGNEVITGSLEVDNLKVDGNTISSLDTDGDINIIPNGLGDVNLLHDGALIGGANQSLNISQTNSSVSCQIASFRNDNTGAYLKFTKSRSPTVGTYTDVQINDSLGYVAWYGSASGGPQFAAQIDCAVDGSVSGSIIPSRLDFRTTNVNSGLQQVALTLDRNNYVSSLYNVYAQNFISNISTIISAAGNTVLTVDSTQIQQVTGTSTQTITMPVVSMLQPITGGLIKAQTFTIINNSTGIVTVNSSGGNLILSMASNTTALITNILSTGTTAASWNASYITDSGASGIVSPGTINQLAYYAATGSTVSGLATANSGVLVTSGAGVPSISTTLPNGIALGTPGSGTLTSCTGLPISTGVSGLGTGVATFLGTPSSANLAAALTDEVGSGFAVFSNSTTYTPVITFGGGSTGITYGFQTGFYTITGRICTFTGSITLTNKGSSTGAAAISIPNVSRTSAAQLITIAAANVTYTGAIYSQINSATSVALINTQVSAGALANITDTGFSNTSTITVSGSYLI